MSSKSPKPILGLVGGIGSGKSTVAAEFGRQGGLIISGDSWGHEALKKPDIREEVVRKFGSAILDEQGQINRRALAAVVFSDPGKLRELEKIVFPFIEQGIKKQLEDAQDNPSASFIVVDAAVMLEAGWNQVCDKIVFVAAPLEQRRARLKKSRGWTEEEIAARSRAQLSPEEKLARSHARIDNDGQPSALAPQVAQLLTSWGIPVAIQNDLVDNA